MAGSRPPIVVRVKNRVLTWDSVAGATVSLDPPPIGPALVSAATDSAGDARLPSATIADGVHTVTVMATHTSADPVGPLTGSGGTATPERVYRPFTFTMTIAGGAVSSVSGNDDNGEAALGSARVDVKLQPVFIRSPNNGSRGSTATSMIIVHHTAGTTLSSAVNTFLSAITSSHYLVDTDGKVLKMVQDGRTAHHAGVCHWDGHTDINSRSIGIEIVNQSGAYPAAQMSGVIGLIQRLTNHLPGIDTRLIIGHSDVGTNAAGRLGRKSGCPGSSFPWAQLEALGWGIIERMGPPAPGAYGGLFDAVPGVAMRQGDSDATHKFGGAVRAGFTGTPVIELQQELARIGYSVGTPGGSYDERTHWAVKEMQEHFFANGRGHKTPDGIADLRTAMLIKMLS